MRTTSFRPCDYCGSQLSSSRKARIQRRAWTLFLHSGKMACPNCREDGLAEELARIRTHLLVGVALAEPAGVYAAVVVDAIDPFRLVVARAEMGPTPFHLLLRQKVEPKGDPDPSALAVRAQANALAARRCAARIGESPRTTACGVARVRGLVDVGDTQKQCAGPFLLAEPAAPYLETAKDKRYRENDRRQVVEKLEDILGVLRRHGAIAEHAPRTSEFERLRAEDKAAARFVERIATIREEMMLRRVYVHKSGGLVVPIGECWVKMLPTSVPDALKEAKRVYRGTHFDNHEEVAKSAPAHAIGNFSTEDQQQLTLHYAEENAEVASRSIMPTVRDHWKRHLEQVRKFLVSPHQYPERTAPVDEDADDDETSF